MCFTIKSECKNAILKNVRITSDNKLLNLQEYNFVKFCEILYNLYVKYLFTICTGASNGIIHNICQNNKN